VKAPNLMLPSRTQVVCPATNDAGHTSLFFFNGRAFDCDCHAIVLGIAE
jgi:hypothetical protein